MRVETFTQKAGRVLGPQLGCDENDWVVIRVTIVGTWYYTQTRLFI